MRDISITLLSSAIVSWDCKVIYNHIGMNRTNVKLTLNKWLYYLPFATGAYGTGSDY